MANVSSKIEYADKVVSNFAEKLNNYNNEMKDNIKQIQNYIASLELIGRVIFIIHLKPK